MKTQKDETEKISENGNTIPIYYAVDYWISCIYNRSFDFVLNYEFL